VHQLAQAAVEGALAAGATYADARFGMTTFESLHARNGVLEALRQSESAGVGVRALIGSSWGFMAVAEPSELTARQAGFDAAEIAKVERIGLDYVSCSPFRVPVARLAAAQAVLAGAAVRDK